MRKLMWFTIGFALICACCAYIPATGWYQRVLLAGAIACLAAMLCTTRWKGFRRPAMVFFGICMGLVWFLLFQQNYLNPAINLDGKTFTTTITATDYSYQTGYGVGVDGEVEINGKAYQIRAYLDEEQQITPGDRITGNFRFRVTTSQGQEGSTYHSGNGTFLLAYETGKATHTISAPHTFLQYAAVIREYIKQLLQQCFPEDLVAFAKALLLGDTYDLPYDVDTAFQISGIRHIVAVSGLHVTILYGLLNKILMKKRFLTALIAFPVLFIFAAVAGFTASVTRACIMVGLMILAQLFRREYDSPTALAFACLVILARNPLAITSVSFQLSVGCVAGILCFSEPIKNWLMQFFPNAHTGKMRKKLTGWFTSSISVTLGAMSLTTPLSAYYFGAVSLVGVLTNIATLWVVNLIFNGIVVVCLTGLLSVKFASLLAWVVSWLMRYVLTTAKLLASIPLAAVYTRSLYIVAWLVFCYLLLTVFLLSKKRRPMVLTCCAVIGLCAALCFSWLEPLLDDCRMTVLDVGQGQSILLQTEGKTFLVDCGGDQDDETADIVAETLLSQGIRSLDGIIVTHADRDHAGALENLLTRIPTDWVLYPSTETLSVTGTECIPVSDDLEITCGDAKITIFGPTFARESNENSLCVLFCTEKCDILITGDRSGFGERMLLRQAELPDVDVLIAGHHGSKNSTSKELLEAVKPETVIISAGADNPYGHPAKELLQRLQEFGCEIYRTDENGTIIYRR